MADNVPESGVASKSSLDVGTPPAFDKDIEAAEEKKEEEAVLEYNPRENVPMWQWILSFTSLCLGALLYGIHP
jgi:hypothetical protein